MVSERERLRFRAWLDVLDECEEFGNLDVGCKRKVVVSTLVNPTTGTRKCPLYRNGPIIPDAVCSGVIGGCGCYHAEIRMLIENATTAKGSVAVVTYSPCTNCANALIHSGVIAVIYGIFTEHDPGAVDRLKSAGIPVWSRKELMELA